MCHSGVFIANFEHISRHALSRLVSIVNFEHVILARWARVNNSFHSFFFQKDNKIFFVRYKIFKLTKNPFISQLIRQTVLILFLNYEKYASMRLLTPTPQNGQTHLNNSLAKDDGLFEYVYSLCVVGA